MRFTFLLLILVNFSLFAKNPECNCICEVAQNLKKFTFEEFIVETDPKKVFYKSIEHLSPFKQNLLKKIWEPELEISKNFIISRDMLGSLKLKSTKNVLDPDSIYYIYPNILPGKLLNFFTYGVTMPFRATSSMAVVIKNLGLKNAKNTLVLGSKVLLSEFIQYPIRNLTYIVSYGVMGEILESFHIFSGDPLIDETDPVSLKKNEVIAIIKLDKGKASGNKASAIDEEVIRELYEKNPNKFFVIDFSQESKKNYNKEYKENGLDFLKNKKIKKLIISAHGSPGKVYSDIGEFTLSKFGDALKNIQLPQYFDNNIEIYFNSCMLALDEFGKKQVNEFAEKTITNQGKVKVNTYYGLAGTSIKNTSKDLSLEDSIASQVKNMGVYLTPLGKTVENGIGILDQRYLMKKTNYDFWMPASYQYEKKQ